MDVRQLRYFISVAEEGNFGRAAVRLHMSQPPLSQQIKALEESLGVTLFVRGRRGAKLTRVGEALLPRARAMVNDFDQVEKMVRRVADGLEGQIRIGIINSVMYGPLPRALRNFQMQHRNVEWTLHELLPDKQIEAIKRGVIDVGFARSATTDIDLCSALIYREPLVVALPLDHPLAGLSQISLHELANESFVLMDSSSPMVKNLIEACNRARFHPRIVYESIDPQTILSLVGVGMGISILPQSLGTVMRENVCFALLADSPSNADLYATYRQGECLPALDHLLKLLEDATALWQRD